MCKSYADRPVTPLGTATGLTSTPVSQHPSRCGTPRPMNPYHYQPAVIWNHPNVFPCSSSNYLNALRGSSATRIASDSNVAEVLRQQVVDEQRHIVPHRNVDGSYLVENPIRVEEPSDSGKDGAQYDNSAWDCFQEGYWDISECVGGQSLMGSKVAWLLACRVYK